jgi:hypothetical protein
VYITQLPHQTQNNTTHITQDVRLRSQQPSQHCASSERPTSTYTTGSAHLGVCPLTPAPCKAQLNNLTTSTTTELQKAHILLSSIIFPRRRQIIPQIEWRSGSTDVYSPAIAPSVDFFGRPCSVRPGKIDNETAIAVNSFISISIKPFSRSIVSSCSNHHTHLRSCL